MLKFEGKRLKFRMAKLFLKHGSKGGDKSLIFAIRANDVNLINEVLSNGVDINGIYDFGITPLLYAIYLNCGKEIIETLLQAGADVNICDFDNMYPLMYALDDVKNNRDIVSLLIEAGADVYVMDTHNNTPLMLALQCDAGHQYVSQLIRSGSDVNAVNMFYETPLLCAVENNCSPHIIYELIINGADVNCDSCFGSPLLKAVICKSSLQTICTLINAGADVNARDNTGRSPLTSILCLYCDESNCLNKEIIHLLLDNGADYNAVGRTGNSILHIVNCRYLINLLIVRYGVSVNFKNNRGETPLMKSLLDGNFEKVTTLLKLGADCNILDEQLNSPLHYVEYVSSCKSIVNLLIYQGANLTALNACGKTPLNVVLDLPFRYLSKNECTLVKSLLKHYVLFKNEDKIYEDAKGRKWRNFIDSFFMDCTIELSKMKNLSISPNLSFYEFCHLKMYKSFKFVDISCKDYNYTINSIQEMFPIYHDLIIMRVKDNIIEKCHNDLIKNLDRLIFRPLQRDTVGIHNNTILNYDIIYNICQYLSHKEIHNLFLASMISSSFVTVSVTHSIQILAPGTRKFCSIKQVYKHNTIA